MSRSRMGENMIARSQAMKYALDLCRLYARFNRPVVFVGPVGAGKTTLAARVHRLARLCGAFVSISAGELGETLYADTLFGHITGAYTGASAGRRGALGEADDGILLVDDLAFMPTVAQAAILRVMQSGRYRPLGATNDNKATCRILFASTVEPAELARAGRLLPDLASRLGEFFVRVPSLGERTEDILPIAVRTAQGFIVEHQLGAAPQFSDNVQRLLLSYDWPGNVRELQAVVERAVAHAGVQHDEINIRTAHLPERIRRHESTGAGDRRILTADLIEATLREVGGNQSEAARRLGVHRNTIGRYLRETG